MTIYTKDGMAFVDLGNGYMLAIGTEAEVEKASVITLAEMISRALATRKFQSLHSVPKNQVN